MSFASLLHDKFTIAMYAELAARILAAGLLGAVIGYERTKRLKEAGMRTHMIVCTAAALMMIVSKYGFADLTGPVADAMAVSKGADPARIAAQVISGVSFLGAGVIFHNGNSVKGLTTAAGLWCTAGIGIAIGSGMYVLGFFTSLTIFVVQIFFRKYSNTDSFYTAQLNFTVKDSKEFRKAIHDYIESQNGQIIESQINYDDDGYATYHITLRLNHEITIEELDYILESNGEVKSLSCQSLN